MKQFKTIEDIKKYQRDVLLGHYKLDKNKLTDPDQLVRVEEQKTYVKCDECGTNIVSFNPNITKVFFFYANDEHDFGKVEMLFMGLFVNLITGNVCPDMKSDDIMRCTCGKNVIKSHINKFHDDMRKNLGEGEA